MKNIPAILLSTLILAALTACKEPAPSPAEPTEQAPESAAAEQPTEAEEPSEPDPCDNPPGFEALELPATLHVYRNDYYLGALTIPETGEPSFEAVEDAPADELETFQLVFDSTIKDDSITVKYGGVRGQTRVTCGVEVKKDTPEYPAALKSYLDSGYTDLRDTPPDQP
jgi:hypothetical protein